jgi:hypothetical protein
MTVPGRIDSARLLLSLDPPPWFLRHARAVAEVAAWLVARTADRGVPVSRAIVEAAGLLHDVDKLLPEADPARRLRHGHGSAAWLVRHGHEELAAAVADHPVTRLADGAWFERWIGEASIEARIVAYADKRAGQRLEPMAGRFDEWARRYPEGHGGWTPDVASAVRRRAERLESDVCALAGVAAGDVGRLVWTGPALARARTALAA